MFRTLSRRLVTTTALACIVLSLTSANALACKNPFSAGVVDDNLPLIAQNDTGKCGGDMSKEGKTEEAMQSGDGKCGSEMSTSGKPASEEKKCEGSMTKDGKPAEKTMQCGSGKCGGN